MSVHSESHQVKHIRGLEPCILPNIVGAWQAQVWCIFGAIRSRELRHPKALQFPTIFIVGSDKDARQTPVQSPKISPAHQRRSPPCLAPATSTDRSSTRPLCETQRNTAKLIAWHCFSLICTDELAGRPTAVLARQWGKTTNVRDETGPRRVTPGGVVGRRARETIPALLLFPLGAGQALCETIPAYPATTAAVRRQTGPGNPSRARRWAHRQEQWRGGTRGPPFVRRRARWQ